MREQSDVSDAILRAPSLTEKQTINPSIHPSISIGAQVSGTAMKEKSRKKEQPNMDLKCMIMTILDDDIEITITLLSE